MKEPIPTARKGVAEEERRVKGEMERREERCELAVGSMPAPPVVRACCP